jgi:hypothetical protein
LLSGSTSITGVYRQGRRQEGLDTFTTCRWRRSSSTPADSRSEGRDFNERDFATEHDAIIKRPRQEVLPEREPIGHRLGQNLEDSGKTEIIGIIRDTKYDTVRDAAPATMYTLDPAGRDR